jgi:hypothetical protein
MIPEPDVLPGIAGTAHRHGWPNLLPMRRLLMLGVAVALVASACAESSSPTTTTTTIDAATLNDDLNQLVAEAESVRGLRFFDTPTVTIVSSSELADRVRSQIDEGIKPDELDVFERLYETLGLLDGSVDLAQAYRDLYAEQVGGYYDDETKEMVIAGDEDLTPLAKSIVVHELIHALTDQQYGFADQMNEYFDAGDYEHAAAIQALVEGDATYYQLVYLQGLPADQQVEAVTESLQADTTVLDSLPEWFSRDLTFAYDAGFSFVGRLVSELGATGVDQAYTHLPESTEQIIHPEKYLVMEPPIDVEVPTIDVRGYTTFEDGVFGEWNLSLYLLSGVQEGEALIAAAGWGGDHYRLYTNGTDVVFLYVFVGDTPRDADELAASLASSAGATMPVGSARTSDGVTTFSGGTSYARVSVSDRTVVYVVSGDLAAGAALAAAVDASAPAP